jgi:peptide/nickel transport system permease protein
MATLTSTAESATELLRARRSGTWRNVLRYTARRVVMLAITVVTAVYLTILIANYGGYVDTIVASRIEEQVGFMMLGGWLSDLPPEERMETAEQTIAAMQDAAGLNDPFLLRSARWLGDGLTLNWGESEGSSYTYGFSPGRMTVRQIIGDHLSRTLLVFGGANILLFGISLSIGLFLNRRHGGLLDRLFILLSPISAAPAWVFGVLLTTIALRLFGFSPGGTFDAWPGGLRLTHLAVLARHLILPFLAILLAGLFASVYAWRSLFQVYSSEDYVDMAYAKGISNRNVDRQYIMRPALPALLTSFALLLVVLWQEIIALEYFFNVHGLGRLFMSALNSFDTPMIVAIVTTFAYLIAITVFILDICYVFVDPRVRLGSEQPQGGSVRPAGRRWWQRRRRKNRSPSRDQCQSASSSGRRRRFSYSIPRPTAAGVGDALKRTRLQVGEFARALARYPSAVFGLAIITILLLVSLYTVIAIPYDEAVTLWRGDGNAWFRHPRLALPVWVNYFRRDDLPPTFRFSSTEEGSQKQFVEEEGELSEITMPFTFDYDYGAFPQEIIVDLTADFVERAPHVMITWVWPDGSERELTGFPPRATDSYYVGRDDRLKRRLRSEVPLEALFLGPEGDAERPESGTYTLRVDALLFEPDTNVDAEVTILGQVYGLAGTDNQRRDLMIALLWGTPVALAFGLVAAIAVSVGSMLVAALGAWYGGALDRIVQFLTEVNLILPFFPIALMVFTMYSRSIVTILGVVVVLTIFGSAVKSYRAAFLQVRTEPYIEAAQAYGASDKRIVARYLFPRLRTLLLPRLIILVPAFVFLEATLAFLGVSDPLLPPWGKLIVAALSYGVQAGATHIIFAPLAVLFLTGFAFAMVGIALERVFEPRLRES